MHPTIFSEYERICRQLNVSGDVLEIGAIPSERSLLNISTLRSARSKIGLNMMLGGQCSGYTIVQANANAMCFADNSFDLVLCNAVFEHDKMFWKMLPEIRRVTRRGGWIVIGTPGYDTTMREHRLHQFFRRFKFLERKYNDLLVNGTFTFRIHNSPGDYYRFSPQVYHELFLEGLEKVEIRTVMTPPRIIGFGVKP
jgi:SAM-dependent methyltransferase